MGEMMFPRIVTVRKPNKTYQYLVISESVRIPGKGSTTRNIANPLTLMKADPVMLKIIDPPDAQLSGRMR